MYSSRSLPLSGQQGHSCKIGNMCLAATWQPNDISLTDRDEDCYIIG